MSTPSSQTTIQTLESRVKYLETKTESWLKNNWAHFVTWLGLAYGIVKHVI